MNNGNNSPSAPLAPFSCNYSPNIPELLNKLNCSIGITTYQAGKMVFLSPKDDEYLVQLPRTFNKPMGIALSQDGSKLALATKDEVIDFSNSSALAKYYPNAPNRYDAMYMPRVTYHTGNVDVHDLSWGNDGRLYAVNTLFSSIVTIDNNFNFTPYWTPPFISRLSSEDRCHLNGMAMYNGKPKYASAFNTGDTPQSWRNTVTETGVIMDLDSNEIIAPNLPMPHSPRIYGTNLFVLLSATGELAMIDKQTGKYESLLNLNGFVRGMSLYKDFLFIGLSKLRKNSSTFAKLEIANKANEAGIAVVHLPTASFYGKIVYQASVDEIYDVQIFPNMTRPNILNTIKDDYKYALMLPDSTFWAKKSSNSNLT